MIIWISSYPKSGNTWMRCFLSSYIFSKNGEFTFDLLKNIVQFPTLRHYRNVNIIPSNLLESAKGWVLAQDAMNLDNKIKFIKTHNALCNINNYPFTNKDNTLGVIYLVRDPRDVLVSYSNHTSMDFNSILDVILRSKNPSYISSKGVNISKIQVTDIVGSIMGNWSENYNSWKNLNFGKKIIIKYEDLINKPFETFLKVIIFLNDLYGLKIDEEKIKKSIISTSFSQLQQLEKKIGFVEHASKDTVFFKEGKIGVWKDKIDNQTIKKIEETFKNEMNELGYL